MRIIFLKIAKNMGTTVKSILRENDGYYGEINFIKEYKEEKLRRSKYLTLINKTNISKFKKTFPDIWDNALKLVVFREPIDRLISCYNYIRNKKRTFKESYFEVIKEMENRKGINAINFDLNKKKYDIFHAHLYSSQLELIDCNHYNISDNDYKWINMDNGNDVLKAMEDLGINNVSQLIKNRNKKKKIEPSLEDIKKYEEVFKEDFIAYDLINNENSTHN